MSKMSELIIQILVGNIKKYKLFIGCNVSAISILFSMLSFVYNKSFGNKSIVDSMISSNIYAPTALVFLFVAIFIPYTYSLLEKETAKNYGILISIGMLEKEVTKCIFIETMILAVSSIVGGIVIGNILSLCAFWIVHNWIVIEEIHYENSYSIYATIIIYTLILYIFSFVLCQFKSRVKSVMQMILSKSESENRCGSKIIFFVGVSLMICSIVLLFLTYGINSNSFFVWFSTCVVGMALMVFNGQFLIVFLKRRNRFVFVCSDFLYYFGRNKKIILASFGLLFIILFFNMFALVTYPNFKNNAMQYHPFAFTYSEYPSVEWYPSECDVADLVAGYDTTVRSHKRIPYLNVNHFAVFDVKEVNAWLGRKYEVDNGQCMYVYCIVENDGYEHELDLNISSVNLENVNLDVKSNVIDILFGRGGGIRENVILVNKVDYEKIKNQTGKKEIYLNLYQFEDWEKTLNLKAELHQMMVINNQWDENDSIPMGSLACAVKTARSSSTFLIFLVVYVSILFFISIFIMLNYKFIMELEVDEHRIMLLRSVGASAGEITKIIREKITAICFIPFVLAAVITLVYSYSTNFTYGYGLVGVVFCFFVEFVMLILLIICTKIYQRYYIRKFHLS